MNIVPRTPWLFPEEHPEVVRGLFLFSLLKFDEKGLLPLKGGGTTDIYVNLRNARSNPAALRFITNLFVHPLRRLDINRFVEIPDAVSCFGGPLSLDSKLPYITIRDTPKAGRATNSNIIGEFRSGEDVVIVDDVITDGQSKIVPYRECVNNGLNVRAILPLVDRQQGWQEVFAKENISAQVWSGMTLHDVRKQLIMSGIMQRCSVAVENANPIIIALDGKNWMQILPLLERLRTLGCILKVNDLMFDLGISYLLPELSVYGRVMADLKGHDIPNTIANICRRFRACPPWAVTVHASGGPDMVKAAVKTLEGTGTKVLTVTVLTSIDPATCEEIYTRLPIEQVRVLAKLAHEAGAHGFVCSPEEAFELRGLYPDKLIITPGVRSLGKEAGDQKRVRTPKESMDAGANYVVLGRQVGDAADPMAEVKKVLTEELNISL